MYSCIVWVCDEITMVFVWVLCFTLVKLTRFPLFFLLAPISTTDGYMCCFIDRSDKTLEDIIYKLVPKLQESKTLYKACNYKLRLNRPIWHVRPLRLWSSERLTYGNDILRIENLVWILETGHTNSHMSIWYYYPWVGAYLNMIG